MPPMRGRCSSLWLRLGWLTLSASLPVSMLASGCARPVQVRAPDPQRAAQRFVRAIIDDDPDSAYPLLSPELRRAMDRERFLHLWRDNRAELLALAKEIEATDTELTALAHLTLSGGERVVLVLENGRYRMSGGLLEAQSLHTPMDAVASLRSALQRQSLPGLLRVLSRERRAAWVAAFERSLEQTADPLDLRVEQQGDEAVVHLTGGGEIHLRREAGRWRVWDIK